MIYTDSVMALLGLILFVSVALWFRAAMYDRGTTDTANWDKWESVFFDKWHKFVCNYYGVENQNAVAGKALLRDGMPWALYDAFMRCRKAWQNGAMLPSTREKWRQSALAISDCFEEFADRGDVDALYEAGEEIGWTRREIDKDRGISRKKVSDGDSAALADEPTPA